MCALILAGDLLSSWDSFNHFLSVLLANSSVSDGHHKNVKTILMIFCRIILKLLLSFWCGCYNLIARFVIVIESCNPVVDHMNF